VPDLDVDTIAWSVVLVASCYLAVRALLVVLRVRWARRAFASTSAPFDCPVDPDLRDRAEGALVGVAIGDALGLSTEQLPRPLVRLRYRHGPDLYRGIIRFVRRCGDVSDDTQLTLCLARSITPEGEYLHERFLDELRQWSYFRVASGRASARASTRLRRLSAHPGHIGEASEGNGAAIRIAPLAILHGARDEASLFADVDRNARATHTGERALAAARFMAQLVREALRSPRRAFDDPGHRLEALRGAAERSGFGWERIATAQQGGTSGHVDESVTAAARVLLTYGLDLHAAMVAIFEAGGDTDSIGAMVGAVIGAQLGASGLPRAWAGALQHRDALADLGARLAAASAAERTAAPRAGEIVVVEGDLAVRRVDAVVNAWNRNWIPAWLLLPQGVSKAIRYAGGAKAIAEVSRRAPLPLGAAVETSGHGLPSRWVIHVAGIDLAWRASEASVRASTRNALDLARCLGARSVALPLVGAGSGGLRPERVLGWMQEEIAATANRFERVEIVTLPRRGGAAG
jgi:ADP-ribosylglycohydrolase/O-acetyl-ADP-ribose deacetylase (regulator of RNase III)